MTAAKPRPITGELMETANLLARLMGTAKRLATPKASAGCQLVASGRTRRWRKSRWPGQHRDQAARVVKGQKSDARIYRGQSASISLAAYGACGALADDVIGAWGTADPADQILPASARTAMPDETNRRLRSTSPTSAAGLSVSATTVATVHR